VSAQPAAPFHPTENHVSMKSLAVRLSALLAALVTMALLAGAAARSAKVLEPDKLVILSTTDVKGKTSPCG
jgi:hypothetical protein